MAVRDALPAALEWDVQTIARQITDLGQSERTRVFHLTWWSERMLDWAMAHPDFKTQLFRFVDVFPACRDGADVSRHLEEYFEGIDVPRVLDFGLGVAEHVPLGRRVEASVARRQIARMARQFIAGESAGRALPELERLWRAGEAATVDLLGEKTLTLTEADRYATRVLEMLDTLARSAASWVEDPHLERDPWGPVPRVNVSVKPTALAPSFSPMTAEEGLTQAVARLRPILDRARELGAQVHVDTEHYDAKDLTYELLRRLGRSHPDGPQLGCVVQAYLKESYDDLRSLVDWSASSLRLPLQVRLVKGAYWDVETITARAEGWAVPVYEDKRQTDANYERCARYLIDRAGSVRPAFASHNVRSISYAIAYARSRSRPDSSFELQLLYGMAEPVHAALRRMGLRVRTYAPVGELVPGMAYLVRRLLENTSNESFIRHRFVEGKALQDLVRAPGVADEELPRGEPSSTARAPSDPGTPGPFDNEPLLEIRRASSRGALAQAVARPPEPFEAPVLIAGEARRTAEELLSVDPGDVESVVCRSGRAGAREADDAIDAARRAFGHWSRATPQERAGVLFRAADIMRRRRVELTALEVFEAGKPWREADADVCEAIDFCEYYGREALRLAQGGNVMHAPGETNAYRYQPRGVGAVISPWNFPLAIPAGMVTAALVCGNCVLFKPAEQTPGVAYRLTQILLEAGLPPGALAFLPGVGEEVGAYLVDHPEVAFVTFTGSKAVGLQIIRRAGDTKPSQRHVKRVVTEMGGKNAIVVDTDADLDQAVPGILSSGFVYAGQKCSAASRVIGIGPVFDELVERLVGAAPLVPVGHPREMETTVGPLIDEDAFARVREYQLVAASEAHVVYRRDDVPSGGWYVGPTLAVTSDPRCRVATEEIFGPLVTCMRADDFEHALALANDTDYALTAGLYSRSPSRIRHASEALRAGNVYVNRGITGAKVGRQPFGGYGMSGVGSKAGGPDYLLQFCEPRVVTENTIRQGFAPLQE